MGGDRSRVVSTDDNMVRQFGDNHKVKLGRNRSKTNGVKLSKMASGLWVSLRYFPCGHYLDSKHGRCTLQNPTGGDVALRYPKEREANTQI